ncbi:TetR/AcrR family transcriptional regulator [Aquisediminimonas sediminicola]|uniref:TetR/AcrR family transcriptional regulator n=1 Tax=Alteraquisediminimonas sediminicola TaxID=2676787 RepID=UPI001C8E0E50|nr:TetR/AcrR family transcriptional regulator [Aquisediminimonas sediminicola]
MSTLEFLALSNMVNSSEAMFDRRRRILRVARKMIGSDGLEHFNMRDLGKKADVSTRTIYNAFGSKETVIALAIYTFFEKFVTHLRFDTDATSFDGALERQITSTLRDVDFPQFMTAVAGLYFSPTLHEDIGTVLHDLATRSWTPWLAKIQARRQLEKSVNINDLLIDLSNLQYAKIHEWCTGAIDAEAFLIKTLCGILLMLSGATKGEARAEIRKTYIAIQQDEKWRKSLFSAARARIDAIKMESHNIKTGALI